MPTAPTISVEGIDTQIVIAISGGGTFTHYRVRKSLPSFEGGRFITINDPLFPVSSSATYGDHNVPSDEIASYQVGAVDSNGVVAYSVIKSASILLPRFTVHMISRDEGSNIYAGISGFPLTLDSVAFSDSRTRRNVLAYPSNQSVQSVRPGVVNTRESVFPLVLHGSTRDSDYLLLRSLLHQRRILCARDPLGNMIFGTLVQLDCARDMQVNVPLAIRAYPYTEELEAA